MTDRSDDPTARLIDVNWDDPRLRDLLKRIDELHLDNRGIFPPRAVLLRSARPGIPPVIQASLVADDGQGRVVVLTHIAVPPGTPLMLEEDAHGVSTLAEVADCHHGERDEDRGIDLFVVGLRTSGSRRP